MSKKRSKGKKTSRASGRPEKSDNVIQFKPRPSSQPYEIIKSDSSFKEPIKLDDLAKADEIILRALYTYSTEEAVRLARKALSVSEDCVDAYVLLAHHADTLEEVIELYNEGVGAGQRVLGEKLFVEDVGHFWGLIETRPYMRALFGLAQSLEFAGYLDDAADCFYGMLLLNPNDNQGVRYSFIQLLIGLDRREEAQDLFEKYDENLEASWNYSRALFDFRTHGDSKIANKSLRVAIQGNCFVPDYLLDHKVLPDELPEEYTIGDDEEAVLYALMSKHAWESDPKALVWLEARTRKKH